MKALFLDLDNTLYAYSQCHEKALNEVALYFTQNFSWSKEKFLNYYDDAKFVVKSRLTSQAASHNRILYFQNFLEANSLPVYPHAYNGDQIYWSTFMSHMQLNEGVLDCLTWALEHGIKIIIVTDMVASIQLQKIEQLKIGRFISGMVTSEEAGAEKPNGIIYKLACEKAGVLPDEVLMVGDSLECDVRGAIAFGIEALHFVPTKLATTNPGINMIQNFSQLLMKLKNKTR